jgi:CYTH domain-containing protein
MKNMEIERKFLVLNEDYKQLATSHYSIIQGYICKEPDRTVRVRIKTLYNGSGSAYITIKSKPNDMGFSRFEWEKEIPVDDAKQLIQMCLPGVIEKTRWLIPADSSTQSATTSPDTSLIWEVDEFHGRLNGLVIAELELESENQPFKKLSFVGEEVTGNPQYYNANM